MTILIKALHHLNAELMIWHAIEVSAVVIVDKINKQAIMTVSIVFYAFGVLTQWCL